MILREAVVKLEQQKRRHLKMRRLLDADAAALGVQALKRCEQNRGEYPIHLGQLLPGETEEGK